MLEDIKYRKQEIHSLAEATIGEDDLDEDDAEMKELRAEHRRLIKQSARSK